jgi:enoyl-CoA hydratase/carnithine racemase
VYVSQLDAVANLVGIARAVEIIASSDDYDAPTAERYGWINRAVPDRELDSFVDALARRLASFDAQALAIAKRSVHRHAPASLDKYRETLAGLRTLISSPATAAQRTALATHAPAVGQDFELRMGHHLGLVSPNT